LIGRHIGANDVKGARQTFAIYTILAVVIGVFQNALIYTFRHSIVQMFTPSEVLLVLVDAVWDLQVLFISFDFLQG
jgi:Na+-driven multidrug efflux pump